jgi:hypothetical protein
MHGESCSEKIRIIHGHLPKRNRLLNWENADFSEHFEWWREVSHSEQIGFNPLNA